MGRYDHIKKAIDGLRKGKPKKRIKKSKKFKLTPKRIKKIIAKDKS